jgi:hypothetical protein
VLLLHGAGAENKLAEADDVASSVCNNIDEAAAAAEALIARR